MLLWICKFKSVFHTKFSIILTIVIIIWVITSWGSDPPARVGSRGQVGWRAKSVGADLGIQRYPHFARLIASPIPHPYMIQRIFFRFHFAEPNVSINISLLGKSILFSNHLVGSAQHWFSVKWHLGPFDIQVCGWVVAQPKIPPATSVCLLIINFFII